MKSFTLLLVCTLLVFTIPSTAQNSNSKSKHVKTEVTCPDCNGAGKLVTPPHICEHCNSSGFLTCKYCKGIGSRDHVENHGFVNRTCGYCNGSGTIKCKYCSGLGRISYTTSKTCKRCNGAGYIYK